MRGKKMQTARDNVVFELGLFMGRLGRGHGFLVRQKATTSCAFGSAGNNACPIQRRPGEDERQQQSPRRAMPSD